MVTSTAAPGADADELLRRGLDWLGRVVSYELATVFLLEEERLVARVARGPLASQAVRHHALELRDFPSLREALETRRAKAFTEHDHAGEGDPFDGVLDLPAGHACMVVPLAAGERVFGVMTLDARRCETYPSELVKLVEVYGQLLAAALQNLEGRAEAERHHAQDHAHAKRLEARLAGEGELVLAHSLSAAVRALASRAKQVAASESPALILGERGAGKSRLAHALHRWSRRADAPFVTFRCGADDETELFGVAPDAGLLSLAHGGTLVLEEVSALSPDAQRRLLRLVQEGRYQRFGSEASLLADVRLIATSTLELQGAVARRAFHEELFHRLTVAPLTLPPLRERLEDLPRLCEALLPRGAGKKPARVSPAVVARLAAYAWPGNLAELSTVLARATLRGGAELLSPDALSELLGQARPPTSHPSLRGEPSRPEGPVQTLEDAQREHIRRVLSLTGGRIYGGDGAAKLLGLKPSTLQSRMKKLGIGRLEG